MAAPEPGPADDVFKAQREAVSDPMRRLFATYGSKYRFEFIVGVLASIVARVLDLLPPLILGVAIDVLFTGEGTFTIPVVPDVWFPTTVRGQFWFFIGILVFSFVVGAGFHWIRNWGWNAFSQQIQHDIRVDTYERMQRLDMSFFADKQTGELMSILSNDVNQLERFLNDGLNSAFRLGVMVIGITVILFYFNWQLALVTLLPVPLIAVFTYVFIRVIQPKYATMRATVGALNSRLENNLGGISVIKTSSAERYEDDRVRDASLDYYDANWDAIRTRIKFFPGLQLLAGMGFVATFIVGGLWVFAEAPGPFTGELTIGVFVMFILYSQRFIWPVAQFGQIINMYQRAHASSARIFGLMDEADIETEDPDAKPLTVSAGAVTYEGVTFDYSGDAPILRDINIECPPGETCAIVGPTGAGKSTLLKLLLRMYDIDSGSITIDGTDIRTVTLESLRQSIGYVGQTPFLFYGTVRENIAYGSFDATDREIEVAARAAEAHEFVASLPDGYETMVGERGVKLSGGQRQRIALARAILKDPKILVLDEATSDVDTETELLIQRSLSELTADRTTFIIAHRLSTIKHADQIIVVDDGRIVERGRHETLIEEDGLYATLWGVQAGQIEDIPPSVLRRAANGGSTVEPDH